MDLGILALQTPTKAAIVAGVGELSYADLDERSTRLARRFAGLGVKAGEHVALLMANGPAFLVAAWAAQRSGLLYTPVNWHLTTGEARHVVSDCGAQVLVTTAATGGLAQAVAGSCHVEALTPDGCVSDPDAVEADFASFEGSYFFYSSGTTGLPKGIAPQHDYPAFGLGLKVDHALGKAFCFDSGTVYLCPAPLYHAAPLGWSLAVHRYHGVVVVLEEFDPVACLRAIEDHRVTHVQFVPTHLVRLLKLPRDVRESFDLSSLRHVVHSAAPCPPDVKREAINWFGPIVTEFYAGSEGVGMTVISSNEWLQRPGSVGRAAVGRLHVVGEGGDELPMGQVGTVYFSGGGTFSYHGDANKTLSAVDHRGWATLGDMGHVDDNGYLYLSDRRVDLIVSGGVNIYPAEVEAAIITHPSVQDVGVIGIPDPEWGQRVHAYIQAATDADLATLVPDLEQHLQSRLASFKRPRSWSFMEELPRLPSGKLLRRELRAAR